MALWAIHYAGHNDPMGFAHWVIMTWRILGKSLKEGSEARFRSGATKSPQEVVKVQSN